MPGPPPKPNGERRRRNAPKANTTHLPAEGRTGETPAWPLMGASPDVWEDLWSTPQAVMWERQGWTRVVARYCQVLGMCEDPDTVTAALLGEARQLEDRLGLTPVAMLKLQWEVVPDEVGEAREDRTQTEEPREAKPKRALKVV